MLARGLNVLSWVYMFAFHEINNAGIYMPRIMIMITDICV